MTKSKIVTIRLDDKYMELVDELSIALGRNRSDVIRLCILFVYLYLAQGLTLTEVLKPLPEVMKYVEKRFHQQNNTLTLDL